MAKSNIKEQIKEQVAHLLMRNNNGMPENAIIQQVTATSNVSAIAAALKEMANISEIHLDDKRWKITPIGWSIYSDPNSDEMPEPYIETIQAHRTPDGQLHTSKEDAEKHMLRQQLLPRIDDFIKQLGSGKRQKGLIRHYIIHWEKFKQEKAA